MFSQRVVKIVSVLDVYRAGSKTIRRVCHALRHVLMDSTRATTLLMKNLSADVCIYSVVQLHSCEKLFRDIVAFSFFLFFFFDTFTLFPFYG